MAVDTTTTATPGGDPRRTPAPPRRALLAGLAAALPTTAVGVPGAAPPQPPAPSDAAFAAALARFQRYADLSAAEGLGEDGCAAWNAEQDEAFAALADTRAPTVGHLAVKLRAILHFLEDHDLHDSMTEIEWGLVWSCLDDAEALAADVARERRQGELA
jgi:hypothetical protein